MALSQQKFREVVLQLLFSEEFSPLSDEEMVPFMMGHLAASKKGVRTAQAYKTAVTVHLDAIDALLSRTIVEYTLERVPRLELAILRLGVYELLHTDLPPKVAIAEALRLARKYATDEAVKFVNAILDKIYQEKLSASALPN